MKTYNYSAMSRFELEAELKALSEKIEVEVERKARHVELSNRAKMEMLEERIEEQRQAETFSALSEAKGLLSNLYDPLKKKNIVVRFFSGAAATFDGQADPSQIYEDDLLDNIKKLSEKLRKYIDEYERFTGSAKHND